MANGIYPIKIFLKQKGNKQKKLTYMKVDAQNKFFFRVEGSSDLIEYDENKHNITVGGKRILPIYSYLINPWNVLLPFIAYEENIEQIKAYLLSINSTMYEKENV